MRGEPSWQRSPLLWASFDRDIKRWVAMGAYVTTIPVQYGHNGIAREKGIDVALAIDVITRAAHQEFEIAVIVSNDRDLSPVVKALAEGTRGVRVEVASWVGGGGSDEVALHAPRVRSHRMDRAIYEHVAGSWDDGSPPAPVPTRLDSIATSAAPGRTEPSTPETARIESAPRGAMAHAFIAAGLVLPGPTASEADSATSSA